MRVALYTGGIEVMYMEFNATGSDRSSWYSRDNIISSSYTDISTAPVVAFSIDGGGRYILES